MPPTSLKQFESKLEQLETAVRSGTPINELCRSAFEAMCTLEPAAQLQFWCGQQDRFEVLATARLSPATMPNAKPFTTPPAPASLIDTVIRYIPGVLGDEESVTVPFLGTPARFPTGPFRLAVLLRRPIVLMFGLYRGGNHYDIHFEALEPASGENALEQSLRRYVERLEHFCRLAPYNWFNFYDYWK